MSGVDDELMKGPDTAGFRRDFDQAGEDEFEECFTIDRKGNRKPDNQKRDTENVPFTYGSNADGADGKDATIEAYFAAEVAPHVADVWVDVEKAKVGYEIPFTRIFYKYLPPRPLEEIDRDREAKVDRILTMLKAVET